MYVYIYAHGAGLDPDANTGARPQCRCTQAALDLKLFNHGRVSARIEMRISSIIQNRTINTRWPRSKGAQHVLMSSESCRCWGKPSRHEE